MESGLEQAPGRVTEAPDGGMQVGLAFRGRASWREVLLPPRPRSRGGPVRELSRPLPSYPLGTRCSVFLALMSNAFAHMLLKLESESIF